MNAPAPGSRRPSDNSPSLRRWRLPVLAGLLLTVLIVAGLWPRPAPVESGRVVRGPLVITVDEEGMTRVKNRYLISTPIAGQLRRIDWKPGAPVEAGRTVLATLESSGADFLDARSLAEARARVRAAEANRESSLAQRDRAAAGARLAAAQLERARQLRQQNVSSPQEYEVAQMQAESAAQETRAADFAVKVAEFELAQAQAVLTRGQPAEKGAPAELPPLAITSPVNGTILRVMQESARVVPAGFPLLEVGDPTDIEARIEVLSRDGVAIKPGARVLLERWGGEQPLNARVRLVEPSAFTKISALGVEEQRVYVVVDFTDPPEKRATLGDSYRVEARIVTWEKPDALHAPAGALFQRGGTWHAFVIEGGRARLRTVSVGRTNGVETEILSGLEEGAELVVYPGDKVFDGSRVSGLTIGAR
jgi:HlyD family secretion protein